jgi:hypothetical protein
LPLFELDRRQHSVSDVFAFWVVEHFDVVEYILASIIAGSIDLPADAFAFEEVEEAFGDSIPPSANDH